MVGLNLNTTLADKLVYMGIAELPIMTIALAAGIGGGGLILTAIVVIVIAIAIVVRTQREVRKKYYIR